MEIDTNIIRIARLAQKTYSSHIIGNRLNMPHREVREIVRELRQQGRLEEVANMPLPEESPLTYEKAKSILLSYARSEEMSPKDILFILARANRPEEAAELLGLGDYEGSSPPKWEAVQYVLRLFEEYGMAWRIQRWQQKGGVQLAT